MHVPRITALVVALPLLISARGVAPGGGVSAVLEGQEEGNFEKLRKLRSKKRAKEAQIHALNKGADSRSEKPRKRIRELQGEVEDLGKSIGGLIPELLQELLKDLRSDAAEACSRATARLAQVGTPAIPDLESMAKSGTPEEQALAKTALKWIQDFEAGDSGLWKQWALKAEASSEYGEEDWSAQQACGKPDTKVAGDRPTAWTSENPDEGEEWLELTYRASVRPLGIRVHETFNPGAVVKIEGQDAGKKWRVLWQGKDEAKAAPACLDVQVEPQDFATRVVRVTLDTSLVKGWNEIDAVQLIGEPTGEALPPVEGASPELTEKERRDFVEKGVNEAIDKGLQALRDMQRESGLYLWNGHTQHGATSLALYTFLAAGRALDDPAAAKALDWLLNNEFRPWRHSDYPTYSYSLIAVAMSYAIPRMMPGKTRDRAVSALQRAADWLSSAQAKGGGWGYDTKKEFHDHSNGQFAILGLRAAANAGAKVKKEVWEREVGHYKSSQVKDGGWAYHCGKEFGGQASTTTMTAAGVMGMAIALGSVGAERTADSLASDPSIRRGLAAMKAQWDRGSGRRGGLDYYLLYSIERACMVTGQPLLGDVDWYVEGAFKILRRQRADGRWDKGDDQVADQCFALLFLKRAYVPVPTPSNAK